MIQRFIPGEENELNALIMNVFDEFVGCGYSAEGNAVFGEFAAPGNIVERHRAGNIILTSRSDGELTGMIEIRDDNHICLFFVKREYQGRGIGRALFEEALALIRGRSNRLEVNASPFSVPIYARLGFRAAGVETETNGIRYTPMLMEVD